MPRKPNGRTPQAAMRLGAQRERQEVAFRREQGWLSFRTGGHSATRGQVDAFDVCDVVAMRAIEEDNPDGASMWWARVPTGDGLFREEIVRPGAHGEVLMIEVKSTAGGPFERFGPTERESLILAAQVAGATPLLVWWPTRGERKEIPVADWPRTRND